MHPRARPTTGRAAGRFRRAGRPDALGATLPPGYDDPVQIGSSAGATVFQATEPGSGRQVAVKVLKADVLEPVVLESFQRQIEVVESLRDHPNIVTLFRSLTTADGSLVLVMELCRGSLADTVQRDGPVDVQSAVHVTIRLAGALETAHRAGLLHRDVKPRNVLLTPFGEPALTDFAVGLLHSPVKGPAGTFEFSAVHATPEALEGRAGSPASDVYGLASTAYELITGQAPFEAFEGESPASVILRILRDPPRPAHSPAIPLELSDLLDAALAKNPEHRPRTALSLAESLQAVESSQGWAVTDFLVWGGGTQSRAMSKAVEPPLRAPHAHLGELPPAPAPRPQVTINQPLLRSAGSGSREPSVNDPTVGPRSVVAPGASGRGQPGAPILRTEPLPPLSTSDAAPAGDRPVFVDPEPPAPRVDIAPQPVQSRAPAFSGSDDAVARPLAVRLLVFVGIAVAAAVVIVAVMLVAGVI